MSVVYRFRILNENPGSAEELINCADRTQRVKPELVGYYPGLPWEDSSTTGKQLILESPEDVWVFSASSTLEGLGYKLIEAQPKIIAERQYWYKEADRSQKALKERTA